MGVPGLWKELHPYGNDIGLNSLGNLASNAASTSSSPQRETLRLGIDVSSWIYHAAKSTGGHNPQLRSFFWRLCRMLTLPHVLPVFVFDGPLRPREKRGRVIQVYREASFVNTLKDLIVAFGFVVVEAAGEAEAEMSRMTQRGSLDAILSDDVDCFVFGATIVVRNWGQELSGTKSRSGFVAEHSPSSEEGDPLASATNKSALSASDRLALGKNLITYYRACDLEKGGLSTNGLILVAILSGGDYDVQGLPRCGTKMATALARAGFGDTLIDGLRKHCDPPKTHTNTSDVPSARLLAPQTRSTWPDFLSNWRTSLRQELSTNESGQLGRKYKKLAESEAFAELLSTKASLSVLGSYVWPLTATSSPVFQHGSIDLASIAKICQTMFHWSASLTLQTFRNQLWIGCATRELAGQEIEDLQRLPLNEHTEDKQRRSKKKKAPASTEKISSFFAAKTKEIIASEIVTTQRSCLIASVHGERKLASTGYTNELRLVCQVGAFVDAAKQGLDFDVVYEDRVDEEGVPSSQSTTASPRKRKPFDDPYQDLRLCLPESLVVADPSSAKQLEKYHSKRSLKQTTSITNSKSKSKADVKRIDSFFTNTKKSNGNVPSKRAAPLQNSSQSSFSSNNARSRSPSPSFRYGIVDEGNHIARSPAKSKSAPPSKAKNSKKSPANTDKEELVRRPEWNDAILKYSDEEESGDLTIGDDSSLPSLHFYKTPARAEIASADDSVEFVKVAMSPTKQQKRLPSLQVIEVSDDSDEDC